MLYAMGDTKVSPITGITSCLEFSQQVSGPGRTSVCVGGGSRLPVQTRRAVYL